MRPDRMAARRGPASRPSQHTLSAVEYEIFRRLIIERFGLDFPPQKRSILATRLARRVDACRLRGFTEYYRLLRYGPREEWRRLAEAVSNNETYFFRDPFQFDELAGLLPELTRAAGGPLRVLSAGCSSGEEAYSLAVVLTDRASRGAGALPYGFEVHGVDLCENRLAEARAGLYSERSFRPGCEPPGGIPWRHLFEHSGDRYHARPALRGRVHFHWRNLAECGDLELGRFDVVFCRNVLIYAEEAAAGRFLSTLQGALRPGGYLFLGPSESLLGRQSPFRPVRVGAHFAYVLDA